MRKNEIKITKLNQNNYIALAKAMEFMLDAKFFWKFIEKSEFRLDTTIRPKNHKNRTHNEKQTRM